MLTPLLAKLRERYPDAEIVMTAPKAIAPLYEMRPYSVRTIPYDPRDPAAFRTLYALRGFDLAIVPGDNRYSWLARALKAQWVIAHADDRPAWKNWPVDESVPYPDTPAAWGDMVAMLIPPPPPSPYVPTDWRQLAYPAFPLPEMPYCVLHVGASSPLKLWNNEKWLALAEYLSGLGYRVVWSGGKGEEKYVAAIDPEQKFISYAGNLTLSQLWHLINNASLLVCPDTGVAHMGRLANTPTIALFGPGSALICGAGNFWQNTPYKAITVADFHCRNQHVLFRRPIDWVRRCGRNVKECGSPECMHAIPLDIVENAADDFLKASNFAPRLI